MFHKIFVILPNVGLSLRKSILNQNTIYRFLSATATHVDDTNNNNNNNNKSDTFTIIEPSQTKFNTSEINNFDLSDDFSIIAAKKTRAKASPLKSALVQALAKRLNCSSINVHKILTECPNIKNQSLPNLMNVIKYLNDEKVMLKTILNNPWLLVHTTKHIKIKFIILQSLRPRNVNDFIPLMKVTAPRLNHISKHLADDFATNERLNRIYLLSDTLQVDPQTVCKYLASRYFIFKMPYENFNIILNLMHKYHVDSTCILRDLWAFRYSPQVVESRLERARLGEKKKLMPWMVRCTEPVLAKTIKNALDAKELLGNDSFTEYIAKRLGYDVESTKYILEKHPAVYNVRITKVKKILDYILDEEKFTPHEVAANPRIMCHSLETTKTRIDELKSHGCRPSSLVIVCRSAREYEKFLKQWIDIKNKKANAVAN